MKSFMEFMISGEPYMSEMSEIRLELGNLLMHKLLVWISSYRSISNIRLTSHYWCHAYVKLCEYLLLLILAIGWQYTIFLARNMRVAFCIPVVNKTDWYMLFLSFSCISLIFSPFKKEWKDLLQSITNKALKTAQTLQAHRLCSWVLNWTFTSVSLQGILEKWKQ